MKLRLVELFNPFDNWQDEQVREMLKKLIGLKISGFNETYEDVLPMDQTDLVADHIIICVEDGVELKPISTFKVVRLSIANRFKFNLPCQNILESLNINNQAKEHLDYFYKLKKNIELCEEDLFYPCSWTTLKEYRGKEEYALNVKWALLSNVYFYMNHFVITDSIVLGMKHIKTDEVLKSMGYEEILINEERLKHLKNPAFNNQEVLLLHMKNYSREFLDIKDRYIDLYENRIILGESNKQFNLENAA